MNLSLERGGTDVSLSRAGRYTMYVHTYRLTLPKKFQLHSLPLEMTSSFALLTHWSSTCVAKTPIRNPFEMNNVQ